MNADKLIQQTALGDKEAFEKLYIAYKGLVFAVALGILKQTEAAEDVLADTFIKVHRSAADFKGGSGKSWLAAISRNLALNKLKTLKRECLTDFTENQYGQSYSIEDDLSNRETLTAALNHLDDKEREVVLLYNSGYKHREIAEITQEKLGTVTWRYKNALAKLKSILETHI